MQASSVPLLVILRNARRQDTLLLEKKESYAGNERPLPHRISKKSHFGTGYRKHPLPESKQKNK